MILIFEQQILYKRFPKSLRVGVIKTSINMKMLKKLSRSNLMVINGGACPGGCPYPPGTGYGPSNGSRTCAAYLALSTCCQNQSFLEVSCAGPVNF
jgi:hypothetical protein